MLWKEIMRGLLFSLLLLKMITVLVEKGGKGRKY